MLTDANHTDDYMPSDPRHLHPAEVIALQRDASRAREAPGRVQEIAIQKFCAEMVARDLVEGINRLCSMLAVSGQ